MQGLGDAEARFQETPMLRLAGSVALVLLWLLVVLSYLYAGRGVCLPWHLGSDSEQDEPEAGKGK